MLAGESDWLRSLVQLAVQEFLEAEMNEALGAGKSQRTEGRLGYRSGYYPRKLISRVGTLDLRVPQDRQGRFSTEIFERYPANHVVHGAIQRATPQLLATVRRVEDRLSAASQPR